METIELEKFEKDLYLEEKEEFLSNKCSDCMNYLNEETEECDNNFCVGKIPEEYRQKLIIQIYKKKGNYDLQLLLFRKR